MRLLIEWWRDCALGRWASVAMGSCLAAASVACDAAGERSLLEAAARPTLRIMYAAGDNGGYSLGFRDALQRAMPAVKVEVESRAPISGSSVGMLQRGDVSAAILHTDVAYLASVGQLPGMAEPFEDIRAIVSLPTRAMQVVVSPRSRATSIRDLRGRRVSLGPPNASGTLLSAEIALKAFGLGLDDVRTERLAFEVAARRLVDGSLDAAFWNGSFPNANVHRATSQGARILEVMGPEIERARVEYPFLKATQIPAQTYPGLDRAVHTVGIDGIFVCRADMDEQLVYDLTKAFFQSVPELARESRGFRGLVRSRGASTLLPLHPGAARYYRELEMLR